MAACSTTSAVDSSCTLGRRIIGNRPALLSSSISIRSTPLWLFSAGAQRFSATPQRCNLPKENYEKLLKRNIKLETEMEEMNSSFQRLKENYERLLKRNVKLKYEMAGMNSSFRGLKDEMLLIREEKSNEEDVKKAVPEAEMIEDTKGCSNNGAGDIKIENGVCHNGVSDKNAEMIVKLCLYCRNIVNNPLEGL